MNIVINGNGKMGKTVYDCLPSYRKVHCVAIMGRKWTPLPGGLAHPSAVIDFSSPGAVDEMLPVCVGHKLSLVIGTTGHSEAEVEKIRDAAATIPIVYASDFGGNISNRVDFAHCAIRAVKWVVRQKPGLYSMRDVLDFRKPQFTTFSSPT